MGDRSFFINIFWWLPSVLYIYWLAQSQKYTKKMEQSQQLRSQFRTQIRTRQIHQLLTNTRRLALLQQKQAIQQSTAIKMQQKIQMIKYVKNVIGKCLIFKIVGQDIGLIGELEAVEKYLGGGSEIGRRVFSGAGDFVLGEGWGMVEGVVGGGVGVEGIRAISQYFGLPSPSLPATITQLKPTNPQILNLLFSISRYLHYPILTQQTLTHLSTLLLTHLTPPTSPTPPTSSTPPSPSPPTSPTPPSSLHNILTSFSKMLDSPHNKFLKQHLKKNGFSQKLAAIIDGSVNFEIEVHWVLLRVLSLYCGVDICQQDLLNGVCVVSCDSASQEKFVVYCIFVIRKGWRKLLQLALKTLNSLFQQNPYFIDSIKTQYFEKILQLALDPSRQLNTTALTLLSTIIFYSQSASDELLQQKNILDFIYSRILLQKSQEMTTPQSIKSIQNCTNILCDLLLTKNQKLKKIIFVHHVWELLYQGIRDGDRLFRMVAVFRFFFNQIPRRDRMKVFPSYLDAVSKLPLENLEVQEIREILQTILDVYYHSLEHSDETHQEVVRLMETYGLLKHLENYELHISNKPSTNK